MSGTSIDAIDAAAVHFENNKAHVIGAVTHAIPESLKHAIRNLCQPGEDEISRMGQLDFELGHLFADATLELLHLTRLSASQISAIGSHGQTIRHLPSPPKPFTLQIGNPAIICERTNISTIADFRRADMAAGGQGAPLVPAFHHAIFYDEHVKRVILNIGGMANISIIEKDKVISGFDTGPGNILLNEWIQQHKNSSYDKNGEWSKNNSVNHPLLEKMLRDKYFSALPPKSTGREYFNLNWIRQHISDIKDSPGNIQSTLCELSAQSIVNAIQTYAKNCEQILVCGGGVHNDDLITRIKTHFDKQKNVEIHSTDKWGIDPDYVEAAAFAWLARQTLHNMPANAPDVTGAKHPVLLGAIYPTIKNDNNNCPARLSALT